MSIASLSDYKNSLRQQINFDKAAEAGGTLSTYVSLWNTSGYPAAGASSPGSTGSGVVPTSSTTGSPTIQPFSGTGYLTGARFNVNYAGANDEANRNSVGLFDRLWHAGNFSASGGLVTLSSQPSFSSRVPGGTDYTGLSIWYEQISTPGGTVTLTIGYTNESGTTGRSTAVTIGVVSASIAVLLPLQAGDRGVRKVDSVNASGGGAGTFNIVIGRRLWRSSSAMPPAQRAYGMEQVGMPQVFSDSCLWLVNRVFNGLSVAASFEIASN